ncbi:MAG: hypothetical protein ACOX9R_01120 [Armatimonadota bacterium]|jgi:hypothetical protein
MRKTALALAALIILSALAVPAMAQDDEEPRITVDFGEGATLNSVLQMFKRAWGFEYTLGENVDPNMPIYTHLRNVNLDQALTSITQPNGLLAIEQNGRYVIRERPQPTGERDVQARDVTPAYAAQDRRPPAATRTTVDYEPRRGAAEAGADGEEERDEIMEIIWPVHLGADMAASIFGGAFIEAGGYFGSGGGTGGYGGQTGGYGGRTGGTSGYGSSGGFGSNRGTSGYGTQRGTTGGIGGRNTGTTNRSRNW